EQRRSDLVRIESAEAFFTLLVEKAEAVWDLARPHPASVSVALASLKRYLTEPRHRIRLHDLFIEEVERTRRELTSERFSVRGLHVDGPLLQQRLRAYEVALERLMVLVAALGYHDTGENAYLLTRCVERLAPPVKGSGLVALIELQDYPALLLTYTAGLAAFANRRFRNLAAVLWDPQLLHENRIERVPAVSRLHTWAVFRQTRKLIPRPDAEREYTPVSEYLFDFFRPMLNPYLPDDSAYQLTFDLFEYVLALTYMALVDASWLPVGSYWWRYRRLGWDQSPLVRYAEAELTKGNDSPLLQSGFFGGSVERFESLTQRHLKWLREHSGGMP
ncbi:MAG: hypothetical protein WBB22_12310, partial [Anaerolineae bacterium]